MSGRVGFRAEKFEEYRRLQKMVDEAASESVNPPTTNRVVDEAEDRPPAHINPKHMRNQSDVQRDALAPRNPGLTGQRADGAPALVGSQRTKQDYDDRPEDEIARKTLNQNKAIKANSTTGAEAGGQPGSRKPCLAVVCHPLCHAAPALRDGRGCDRRGRRWGGAHDPG